MNKPLLRPLALAGFAVALGLLGASFCPFFGLLVLAALAACGGIAAGILYASNKIIWKIPLVLLLSLLAALGIGISGRFAQLRAAPWAGQEITFSGEVRNIWRGDSVCYGVEAREGPLPEGTEVLLYSGTEEYIPGDRITARVSLWDNAPSRSQLSRGADLCGYASAENIRLEQPAGPVSSFFAGLRGRLRTGLYRAFPKNTAEFFIALFSGDDSGLPGEMARAFSALGISHVLCVSGLHISLLTAAVCGLCSRLLGRGKAAFLLAAAAAGGFVLFTGAESPAVRAYLMALFSLSARFFCRDYSPANSLGGAVLLICLADPRAALSNGFWMSALATAAIFSLAPGWTAKLREKLPQKAQKRPVRGALAGLCTTAAANLACLPVYFLWFGSVPWKSFLPNLVLTPLLPALAGLACLSLLPGFQWVGGLLGGAMEPLFRAFAEMARGNSYLPLHFPWAACWGTGSAALLFAAFRYGAARHRRLAVSLSVFLLSAGILTGWASGRDVLSVSVVSAGSGQSIVLSQNGRSIAVGCGGSHQIGRKTAAFLRSVGAAELDALIVPAETALLMDGTADLSREIPPEKVLAGAESNWSQTLSDMELSELLPPEAGEYRLWENARLVISGARGMPDIGVFSGGRSILLQSASLPAPESGWDAVFFYDEIYKKDGFSISGYAIIKASEWQVPPSFLEGCPLFGEYFAAEERFFFPPRD